MVYLVREVEQPKKRLNIQRLKVNIPKGDFLSLLILLLVILDILSLLFTRQADSGITGLIIGLAIYHVLHKEELKQEGKIAEPGEIKVITPPSV